MDTCEDLLVLEGTRKERYSVYLSYETMKKMCMDSGETIILKSKRGNESTWLAYPNHEVPENGIVMSRLIQRMVPVHNGEIVSMTALPNLSPDSAVQCGVIDYTLPPGAPKHNLPKIWFHDCCLSQGFYV